LLVETPRPGGSIEVDDLLGREWTLAIGNLGYFEK